MDFHASVPAEGTGRRLWPVPTATRPEFLLSLDAAADGVGSRGVGLGVDVAASAPASRGAIEDVGGASIPGTTLDVGPLDANQKYSLARSTAWRLAPLAVSLAWVTGAAYTPALQAQIKALGLAILSRSLAEPEVCDSLAAIELGMIVVEKTCGTAVVDSFTADHHLGNVPAFARVLHAAKAGAEAEELATIGITPTETITGYGYIEIGDRAPRSPGRHPVKRSCEEPDATTTRAYLETGRYL